MDKSFCSRKRTAVTDSEGSHPTSKPRATIAEVAERAGVSPTTVSHVLSGKRLVSESTKATVREAIRELDYRPNAMARSLRTRRSQMVAIVVPDLTNPFFSVVIRGLADTVEAAGYATYVCNTDGLAERERAFLDDMHDRSVDGIVIGLAGAQHNVDVPEHSQTPIVCIGGAFDHPAVDLVAADDEVGSRAAVAHLVARGARRIAMIQGSADPGRARDHGYRQALTEAGITYDKTLMQPGDWTRQGGRKAMRKLMQLPRRPDAVFCANDLTAIGAMDVARELSVSIPADVALVGFDDIEAAALVHPGLTTVQNPAYDTGTASGKLLLSRMSGEYAGAGRRVLLPCPLIRRESA
jgi:LacI family transcriptional regulator